jgi:hypothetical protein
MVDYKKGKIYQIKNTIDDDIYVGSTTNTLEGRMKGHRQGSNTKCKQHMILYNKMNEYGFDKFFVELIEEYPCNSKIELGAREGHWIKERGTLNKIIQGRTKQDWNDENKDVKHNWYVKNLDKIREQMQNNPKYKAKVVCECGLEVSQRHLNEHKITLTHQRRMGVEEEHIISHYDKEKQALYRATHKDQINENNRRYRERNKQQP